VGSKFKTHCNFVSDGDLAFKRKRILGKSNIQPKRAIENCKLPPGEWKRGVAWTGDNNSASYQITLYFLLLWLSWSS